MTSKLQNSEMISEIGSFLEGEESLYKKLCERSENMFGEYLAASMLATIYEFREILIAAAKAFLSDAVDCDEVRDDLIHYWIVYGIKSAMSRSAIFSFHEPDDELEVC